MGFIKTGGEYKDIKSMSIKNGGSYTEVLNAFQKIEGSYVKFYEKTSGIVLPAGALVFLTPESAYNSLGEIAQNGELVSEWRNEIQNGTTAAIQTDTARQPIVETVNDLKQIRFNGSGDFLSFGITSELDFPQPETDYTIILVCGTGQNITYWASNLSGSSGQMGVAFSSTQMFFHDGVTFRGYPEPAPTIPTMITVQRDNTNGLSLVYQNTIQRLNIASTPSQGSSIYNFLIGSRTNNDANSLNGSLRYFLVFKRLLTEQEITDLHAQLVG